MKKNFLFSTLVTAAIIAACTKTPETVQVGGLQSDGRFPVSISVDVPKTAETKLNGPMASENSTDSALVIIFDKNITEAYGIARTGEPLTLDLTRGHKTAWVFVNFQYENKDFYKNVIKNTDQDAPDATLLGTLKGGDKLEMFANEEIEILSSTETINLSVKRLAAKIQIDKITNNLNSGSPMTIKRIFLCDAYNKLYFTGNDYASQEKSSDMVNVGGQNLSSYPWFTESMNITLNSGQSTDSNFKKTFYCAPNTINEADYLDRFEDPSQVDVFPMLTKLVIEVEFLSDFEPVYYPICLHDYDPQGIVASNHFYHIKELKIKHIGSPTPEKRIQSAMADFSVEVIPWEEHEINQEF